MAIEERDWYLKKKASQQGYVEKSNLRRSLGKQRFHNERQVDHYYNPKLVRGQRRPPETVSDETKPLHWLVVLAWWVLIAFALYYLFRKFGYR